MYGKKLTAVTVIVSITIIDPAKAGGLFGAPAIPDTIEAPIPSDNTISPPTIPGLNFPLPPAVGLTNNPDGTFIYMPPTDDRFEIETPGLDPNGLPLPEPNPLKPIPPDPSPTVPPASLWYDRIIGSEPDDLLSYEEIIQNKDKETIDEEREFNLNKAFEISNICITSVGSCKVDEYSLKNSSCYCITGSGIELGYTQ